MQLSQQQVFTASHAVHKANPYRTAPPVTANSMRSHNRNCHPLHLPWAHRRGPWAAAPGRSSESPVESPQNPLQTCLCSGLAHEAYGGGQTLCNISEALSDGNVPARADAVLTNTRFQPIPIYSDRPLSE